MTPTLLQIYFQSGDFTLEGEQGSIVEDLFVNAFGAFLGFLLALALYYWQVGKQQKDKLKYVQTLIDSCIPYARAQAKNCETLASLLIEEPTKLHLLPFQANYDLKRLADKLDQEAFYHAFLAQYKRTAKTYQAFSNIYSHVDFIDHLIDQLKDFLEKENLSIVEKKKDYVAQFNDAEEKAVLLTVNPTYQNNRQLIDFLNHHIVSYHNTPHDDTDLAYPYTTFIEPVLRFLATNFPTNSDCNAIVVPLKRAVVKYHAVIRQSQELAQELKSYQEQLKDHACKLEVLTQRMREDFADGM